MDEGETKALNDISEFGCHILNVMEGDGEPRFTYSIGIQATTSQPDLVVTGLKFDLANSIINRYCQHVQTGQRIQTDKYYNGYIEGFSVTFRTVLKEYYKKYFGWGIWYSKGNDFDMLQVIYPSVRGKWPWNKDAPEDYCWFIPKLYMD